MPLGPLGPGYPTTVGPGLPGAPGGPSGPGGPRFPWGPGCFSAPLAATIWSSTFHAKRDARSRTRPQSSPVFCAASLSLLMSPTLPEILRRDEASSVMVCAMRCASGIAWGSARWSTAMNCGSVAATLKVSAWPSSSSALPPWLLPIQMRATPAWQERSNQVRLLLEGVSLTPTACTAIGRLASK